MTDYFALSDGEEKLYRKELLRLKEENNIKDDGFYHYDTPLTVAHETESLLAGGFSKAEILNCWGATHTLKAYK